MARGMKMESLQDVLQDIGIKSEPDNDRFEYAKQRAEWANKIKGTLTGYNCELCLNRGFFMVANENGTNSTVECKCMKTRKSLKILKKSGLEDLVKESTFKKFETDVEWREEAKKLAQAYAVNSDGKWFVASGEPGSGKTHLCVAICREYMLRGVETRYVLWRSLIKKLKASMNTDKYESILDELRMVDILYIDDFLKVGRNHVPSESDIGIAFEIINDRYNKKNSITLISTERSIEEIMYLDTALGSRIYERSRGFYLRNEGKEKDYRIKVEE